MGRTLKKTQEVECQSFEAPPSLFTFDPNLSCQLSTHGHGHATKDMLYARSD